MSLLKFGVIAFRQMCKVKLSVYLGKLRFGLNIPFRQSLAKGLEFWVEEVGEREFKDGLMT